MIIVISLLRTDTYAIVYNTKYIYTIVIVQTFNLFCGITASRQCDTRRVIVRSSSEIGPPRERAAGARRILIFASFECHGSTSTTASDRDDTRSSHFRCAENPHPRRNNYNARPSALIRHRQRYCIVRFALRNFNTNYGTVQVAVGRLQFHRVGALYR